MRYVVALLVTIVMAGCAQGPSSEEVAASKAAESSAAAEKASASAAAAAEREAEREAEEAAEAEAEWQDCVSATEDLQGALEEIHSRLSVGLNVGEFSERVGDAQVAYDDLPFDDLDPKCTLNVGVALEDALNQYIKSLNRWNSCVEDFNCQVEGSVLRKMRRHWREAGERLDHVDEVLESPESYADAEDFPS